jgi:hypothetical protein
MIAAIGAVAYFYPPTPRKEEPAPKKKLSIPTINLRKLASGTVPAHGLVVTSRGIIAGGFGGKFLFWLRKLLGAVSVAGMIALGLFVYTEFTQAWQKRGLPTIPISALAALDQAAQQGQPQVRPSGSGSATAYQPNQQRRGGGQQTLSLLDDYIG